MKQPEQLGLLDASAQNAGIEQSFQSAIRAQAPTLDTAIQRIFASPGEETRVAKARRHMGEGLDAVSDEETELYLTELQHLVDAWFDVYEREVFDGETLKQLLGQA